MKPKVLLIGWDAADWKIIGPLLAKGQMPALKKLINKGVYGNMATMNPPYSPMLWSTVATGKTPDKHGVLGFIELMPNMKGIRPVTVTSRKVKAVWNILHNKGYKSNLVSWWPSHPAEPINGVVVTDKFQKVKKNPKEKNPFLEGTFHPKSYLKKIGDLRMFPTEVTDAHILPFIPKAHLINQEKDRRLDAFAKILAENTSVHCAATNLMRTTEWDFMAVYYDCIDHFCHAFMKFYPPKQKAIPQKLFEIYNEVIANAYRYQDMMLDRMLDLVDDNTTVIVMSDHGFESGHKRILKMPKFPAAPALEHRQFGVFIAAGPQIKQNEKAYGLSLVDICPTLLHLFDLPIGKDMDGNVALDIFKDPKKPSYIDSWENIEGDFGQHKKTNESDALSDQDAMEQLIELGYIDRPDEKIETAILKTKCDLKYNLARIYVGKRELEKAKEILLKLIKEKDPIDIVPYYMELLRISLKENEFDLAQKYLDKLRSLDKKFTLNTNISEAKILIGKGKIKKAIKLLELAKEKKQNSSLWNELGKLYFRLNKFNEAKNAFEKAIKLEPDNARSHQLLAKTFLKLNDPEEAADHAFISIELIKFFPEAHYILGESLEKLGDLENAKKAFEVAAKLKPKTHYRAKKAIENIDEKLVIPKEFKDKNTFKYRKEQIVIVSGLPRSGTSLMMQMLNAGGISPLTDNNRKADESNPKGYFEYDAAKTIHKDNSWLNLAKDKSVKVVAPLLKFLDPKYRYKVIFMNRDLTEIITSQQKMIGKDSKTLPISLFNSFKNHLSLVEIWKNEEPGVELIYVNYKDVLNDTVNVAAKIESFIGIPTDKKKMAKCVDTSLYRNKSAKFKKVAD